MLAVGREKPSFIAWVPRWAQSADDPPTSASSSSGCQDSPQDRRRGFTLIRFLFAVQMLEVNSKVVYSYPHLVFQLPAICFSSHCCVVSSTFCHFNSTIQAILAMMITMIAGLRGPALVAGPLKTFPPLWAALQLIVHSIHSVAISVHKYGC